MKGKKNGRLTTS